MTIAPDTVRHHACLEAGGAHYLTSGPDGLHEADPDTLRRRLDAAAAARPHTPAVALGALALLLAVAAGTDLSVPAVAAAAVLAAVLVVAARRRDHVRRTVLATHELPDHERAVRHERLVSTWDRLRRAATSWEPAVWEAAPRGVHVPVVRRGDGPRHLRADLPVPTFCGGPREIAFLPDRVVLRDGRFHTVVGYGELTVDATVRERAEGGRLGRLTVCAAGITTVFDLTSVDAAHATAAALRGLTDAQHRRTAEVDLPARTAARTAARRAARADAVEHAVPRPRQASEDTGRSCASPTLSL